LPGNRNGRLRKGRAKKRLLFLYNPLVMITPELLEILVCPVCRKPLTLRGEESLKCHECHRAYPIRNGIPIMLEHEATIETL
jgi:LSD1 subclass zinc finger protein